MGLGAGASSLQGLRAELEGAPVKSWSTRAQAWVCPSWGGLRGKKQRQVFDWTPDLEHYSGFRVEMGSGSTAREETP